MKKVTVGSGFGEQKKLESIAFQYNLNYTFHFALMHIYCLNHSILKFGSLWKLSLVWFKDPKQLSCKPPEKQAQRESLHGYSGTVLQQNIQEMTVFPCTHLLVYLTDISDYLFIVGIFVKALETLGKIHSIAVYHGASSLRIRWSVK